MQAGDFCCAARVGCASHGRPARPWQYRQGHLCFRPVPTVASAVVRRPDVDNDPRPINGGREATWRFDSAPNSCPETIEMP